MKKIILILSVILVANVGSLNAQNDTLAILQSIVANKSNYIGQSFSVLLNQLPIQVKFFAPNVPRSTTRNKENSTTIAFTFPYNPSQLHLTYPQLWIYWTTPLNRVVSNSLFIQTKGAWSSTIASHYGSAVISDIRLVTE